MLSHIDDHSGGQVDTLACHKNGSFRPDPFVPAFGLAASHAQIIAARLLRPSSGIPLFRHRIDTPDGDFLDLDFTARGRDGGSALVVLLHGLEGSARSRYAIETYRNLEALGLGAVGLNFRSCSGELNRTPRMYHSGETEDVRHVMQTLAHRFPDRKMAAIGFSLGGNVLLKYLGENRSIPSALRAAAAISVPYQLSDGADYLERGFSRLYRWKLMRSLRSKIMAKKDQLEGLLDLERVARSVTFREFDDAATAPLHGFEGAEDYYARSSSKQFLPAIAVPTYLIHSYDDPFLPPRCVPVSEVRENPHLCASFHPVGGHVGFIQGSLKNPQFWAERAASRFILDSLAAR